LDEFQEPAKGFLTVFFLASVLLRLDINPAI
jgi:hypothetical protein